MTFLNPLISLAPHQGFLSAPPHIAYAYSKYEWAKGEREMSLNYLNNLTSILARDCQLDGMVSSLSPKNLPPGPPVNEWTKLLARCFVKLSQWQVVLQEGWEATDSNAILHNYLCATWLDPTWYKAWHTWALANFEVISFLEQSKDTMRGDAFAKHIVPAVQGAYAGYRNEISR